MLKHREEERHWASSQDATLASQATSLVIIEAVRDMNGLTCIRFQCDQRRQ